jgi:hypothetical protein
MDGFAIQNESDPVRCEICHQSDQFNPKENSCERCRVLKGTRMTKKRVNIIELIVCMILSGVLGMFFGIQSEIAKDRTLQPKAQEAVLKKNVYRGISSGMFAEPRQMFDFDDAGGDRGSVYMHFSSIKHPEYSLEQRLVFLGIMTRYDIGHKIRIVGDIDCRCEEVGEDMDAALNDGYIVVYETDSAVQYVEIHTTRPLADNVNEYLSKRLPDHL